MKKKLLFVMPSMGSGGAEKSLVTVLSLLDYSKYDVDLFLFRKEGLFLSAIPSTVNVLDGGEDYRYFDGSSKEAMLYCLRHLKLGMAVRRYLYGKAQNLPESERKKKSWALLSKALPKITKEYDAAIGYLEGMASYYVSDCVCAKIKIGYIHNDYKKLGLDKDLDTQCFRQLDYLVTVSDACVDSLKDSFPQYADKVRCVENIISVNQISEAAQEQVEFDEDYKGLRVCTVGRLNAQKGLDMAVEVCRRIADKVDFRWYVLGEGALREELEAQAKQAGVEDRFILLGTRSNPYPYVRRCDIYAQPSRFEGKSVAIEEAKCLRMPIVTTAYTTVRDQIEDGVTGSIAEISVDSIEEKLFELLTNEDLRATYRKNLSGYTGNISEIEKFYAMING